MTKETIPPIILGQGNLESLSKDVRMGKISTMKTLKKGIKEDTRR